jgi:hypothetical protein
LSGQTIPANAVIVKVCTSKRPRFDYHIIKSECAKYQNTNIWWRIKMIPPTPVVDSSVVINRDNVGLRVLMDSASALLSAPILYFVVTDTSGNFESKVIAQSDGTLTVSGLRPNTEYKLKVSAVNLDGASPFSQPTRSISILGQSNASTSSPTQSTPAFIPQYSVGDSGPGGGIIFYVSTRPFSSPGSTCGVNCHYLEVAPSTWQNGISETDLSYVWSLNTTTTSGQDNSTPGTEGRVAERANEKANWRIGVGLSNTSLMRVAGTTSDAQAKVFSYAGNDASAGQWFIPSVNELNELCKFVRGQQTGDPTVACANTGIGFPISALNPAAIGFDTAIYWSSSERDAGRAWLLNLAGGYPGQSTLKVIDLQIRPIRAL